MTDANAQIETGEATGAEAATDTPAPPGTSLITGAQTNSEAKADEAGGVSATAKDGDESQTKASEEIAPFELNLTLPDGLATDEARLKGFTGTITEFENALAEAGGDRAKVREVIAGMANKLVGSEAEAVKAVEQQQADMVREWRESAMKDAEFGGAKFDENMGAVAAVRDRFGSDGFNDLLDTSGMGNHPEVIRFFHSISKVISETNPAGGGAGGSAPPKTHADRIYGS